MDNLYFGGLSGGVGVVVEMSLTVGVSVVFLVCCWCDRPTIEK